MTEFHPARTRAGATAPNHNPFWKKLLWFAAIWLAGIGTLSVVAYAIRMALIP